MSIYNIPEKVHEALPLMATPNNIQSGFCDLGVWTANKNLFTEDEFFLSAVTDPPCLCNTGSLSVEVGKPRV